MQFTQSTLSADRKYYSVGHLLNEAGSNTTNPLTQGGHACCICRSGVWFIACPFARPSVVCQNSIVICFIEGLMCYIEGLMCYIEGLMCCIEGLMCLYRRPGVLII